MSDKDAAELRAVQAAENERKRIEAEQFAQAEAERKAEEARLADKQHKNRICNEALKLIGFDADEPHRSSKSYEDKFMADHHILFNALRNVLCKQYQGTRF
ncbi:hypothetical protein [Acinetobacter sp. NS-4]|uniref:hypothetical protein n=1 Tax=Acinetobacter sp. NS-4 TaxID=3127956 RepID=UPI00307E3E83